MLGHCTRVLTALQLEVGTRDDLTSEFKVRNAIFWYFLPGVICCNLSYVINYVRYRNSPYYLNTTLKRSRTGEYAGGFGVVAWRLVNISSLEIMMNLAVCRKERGKKKVGGKHIKSATNDQPLSYSFFISISSHNNKMATDI